MKKTTMNRILTAVLVFLIAGQAWAGERFNFNAGWKVQMGKNPKASGTKIDDSQWQTVTLPWSFNQHEAFAKPIAELTDTVAWYRKHFTLPKELQKGKKFFIEFEGARFGARVFLNGKELGWSDNGVMAFGFDLTPYIKRNSENILAVYIDNNWRYKEHFKTWSEKHQKEVRSGFQWNDKNFYCNYGGINKNVWLHVMNSDVYQTLPLYSNLQTTGVYIYATEHDIKGHSAVINAESEVMNESQQAQKIGYEVVVCDKDGKEVASLKGEPVSVEAGQKATLRASQKVGGLHFWSWGYGYLYTVKTSLVIDGKTVDSRVTRTGFHKTEFKDGEFRLNGRTLQLKGFAQRSTNEWPAVGISVPAWMSDYSNRLVLGCNGNFFRWMHVTPMKQDVESFDRLGLIQAMPAGDAEKDVNDRRWQQRTEVMRIAKDSWFVHQTIWDGWVDTERDHTYIIGHWSYDKGVVKPVYVASTGDEVELLLNGKSLGKGERTETFLFTFKDVTWQPGTLEAVSYKNGKECSRHAVKTAGKPVALRMAWVDAPQQFRADGSDIRIAEIEAVDKDGQRHPLAHDMVTFDVKGNGEYLGGVSGIVSEEEKALNAAAKPATEGEITAEGGHSKDTNGVLSKELMLEAGVIRVMVRSTTKAGTVTLTAKASGYKPASLTTKTVDCPQRDGFYVDAKGVPVEAAWQNELPCDFSRGETPLSPSYAKHYEGIAIKSIDAAVRQEEVMKVCDDNEDSKWSSDGHLDKAWLTFHLARPAAISRVMLRMDGFRKTSYPLEITDAKGTVLWTGYTPKSLGNVYLDIEQPVKTDTYTIRMLGAATVKEAFGSMTELAAKKNVSTKASKSNTLSIIEVEFNEKK